MATTLKPIALGIDPKADKALYSVINSIQELNKSEARPAEKDKKATPARKARGKDVVMSLLKAVCHYASDDTLAALQSDSEAVLKGKDGEKPLAFISSVADAKVAAQTAAAPDDIEEAAGMLKAIYAKYPDLEAIWKK